MLVVIDTLRADHLPFYGYHRATAPNLGRLAREGILFRRAHSTSSYTAPATASLMTSLLPYRHGVLVGMWAAKNREREVDRIADGVETMAEVFKAAGYTTFAVTVRTVFQKNGCDIFRVRNICVGGACRFLGEIDQAT